MATPPTFSAGSVLTAAQMNAVGMWLVKSQAVGSTPVSSVTLTNVFSSDYDAYKIIWAGGTLDIAGDVTVQLGPSSISGWNSGYFTSLYYFNGSTASSASTTNTEFAWCGGGNGSFGFASCELYNPNRPQITRLHLGSYQNGTTNLGTSQGWHNSAGQFTSVTLGGGGGSKLVNGTISVYGYRK